MAQNRERPIVTVKEGKLKGTIATLNGGESYFVFKGIPYAAPPVGDLRFMAPQPPISWSGVRDASTHGAACPQYDMTTMQLVEGSEDCLFLNVYSKSLESRVPVMVFIHGGGFMSGSGDDDQYGPKFLIQHDVVLVTINYRLEVHGFLVLDIPEVPGNAGLKDQVFALRWVKENIAKFGGDPDKITIFGESAGAASVTYHMVSPMSKGLFHRAIAQSGTCIHDWTIAHEPRDRAFRVGKALGKETKDPYELLEFLQSVPAVDLARMTFKTATEDEKKRGLPLHFVPNVERKFENVEAFITENPINALLAKKNRDIPLMIGYTSGEGFLMSHNLLKKSEFLNENPSYLIPREIVERVSEKKLKEFGRRILKFYTNNKGFDANKTGLVDVATDVYFGYQTHRFAHFHKSCSTSNIYMYRFEFETELNFVKRMLGTELKGACHADDIFYLFSNVMNNDLYNEQGNLRAIVDRVTKLWTDFAKTGNPTPKANSPDLQWKPYTAANKEYLALDQVMSMKKHADKHRVEFWNKLYSEAGLPYITRSTL